MSGQPNPFEDTSPTDEDYFLFTSESVGEGHPGRVGLGRVGSAPPPRGLGFTLISPHLQLLHMKDSIGLFI